jgi:hypothetical protein
MIAISPDVSGPGFISSASGIAALPISWKRAAISSIGRRRRSRSSSAATDSA